MSELQSQAASGIKWSAIERLITQLVQLLIMLVLARQLGPQAFGLVGMLAVFLAISQVFVESGMGAALIRKLDRTEQDFTTAFYFNIAVGVLCYLLLYICAPFIADFYQQPQLTNLLRWLALVIIIHAFSLVPKTRLTIDMDFKKLAVASFGAVTISSGVALVCAYQGVGVWSLVAQSLSYAFSHIVILNIVRPWTPKRRCSKDSFNYLFGFGSKLMLAGLLNGIYQNIYQIIIGKYYSAVQVGYFTQANQLVKTPAMTMTTVIQRVTYPMLSRIQDDIERLKAAYLITLQLAALVVFPLLIGLAVVADPLIPLMLGEVWRPAAELVPFICLALTLYPIHAINLNMLQVKGRADLFLKLEVVKKGITTVILICTVPLGLKAICIGMVVQSCIAFFINSYYNGKLNGLSVMDQLRTLLLIFLMSSFACGVAWYVSTLISELDWVRVVFTILLATFIYIVSVRYLQPRLYSYIVKSFFAKKEN
ncbi:lipopolysaccharide biosynthesis protein [Pseudoalteromonas rubra]|uniref:lipopolysaccharide biosynthesis protein n=1 Tax=Pseudoalteromonas rubra TaxID=43658 RepID=UPI000F774BFC|nr:lipopolysaccharide biosynthesis protein [Pseudoalteromonas rubra]